MQHYLRSRSDQEALDADWFDALVAIKIPKFQGHNYKDAQRAFYRSLTTEPVFEYRFLQHVDIHHIGAQIGELLALVDQAREIPTAVRLAYQDKLQELNKKLEICKLSQALVVRGVEYTDEIQQLVEQVYGAPKQAIFDQLRHQLKRELEQKAFPYIRSRHYERISHVLTDIPASPVPDLQPIPKGQEFPDVTYARATDVAIVLRQVMQSLGFCDWSVVISKKPAGGFVVKPLQRRVVVPSSKVLRARKGERRLTEERLQAIIAHEIMTHVVRAHNGYYSPLRLLSVGLSGYWRAEEGIASYREQLISGAHDYANQAMYFAIGLAYGLDRGGEKRTFLETFKLLHDYYYVFHGLSGRFSKQKAFVACHRVYRGATGRGSAYIMTKDVAYREGNIAIHAALQNRPRLTEWFDIGKFDPTNKRHISILRELKLLTPLDV